MISRFIKLTFIAGLIAFLSNSCQSSTDSNAYTAKSTRTDTVIIRGMAYHPAELSVEKGGTVVWINKDIVPHDVTAFPGEGWTSDTIALNQTWAKVIEDDMDYFCSIHVTMKGKITMKN